MILISQSFLKRRSGMALVMVVLMLALMLTFMLAVYSMSDAELKGANRYASGQQVRQFGDLAVDVAIAQVRKGTTPNAGTQGREVWTSQPGLIRQYQASGELQAGYKLYSSSQMIVPAGADAEKKLLSDTPPANWQELKTRYVDLNRPIHRVANDGGTTLQFPIIDPRAMTGGTDSVSGFSYSDKLSGGSTLAGVKTSGGDAQRLPMPVEWLYVLSDGTLGTLDAQSRFVGAVVPTVENPIVGRIAFWADDESSKVNINTASEPTPWAVPTFYHEEDADYARYQPVSGELQRYPGHPATTALSPILFPGKTITLAEKNIIYALTPKIGPGGSQGGTASYTDITTQLKLSQFRKERLYASLDEYLLREDRQKNDFGINVNAHDVVQRKGFFLTAHSRAPELNLHGLPKIALWPVSYRGEEYGTSFDQLVAFCSTLRQQGTSGLRKYIFQRGNADSTTADIEHPDNQALLTYLNNLLQNPIPGFAAAPSMNYQAKYGDDLPQILAEIFDYVRGTNLHDGNIAQQTITPPTQNYQNYMLGYATGSTRELNFKTFTDPRIFATDPDDDDPDASNAQEGLGYPGHGQVTPSQWKLGGKTYQGIGRFPTITEVGLHFICAADNTNDPDNRNIVSADPRIGKQGGGSAPTLDGIPQERWYSNFPPLTGANPAAAKKAQQKPDLVKWPYTSGFPYGPDANHMGYKQENWNHQLAPDTHVKPGQRRVQARLLLEFFVPAAGYTLLEPEFTVKVSGLSQFYMSGDPNKKLFPNDYELFYTGNRATHVGNQMSGGYGIGLKGVLRNRFAPHRNSMPADPGYGDDKWKIKPSGSAADELSVVNYDLLSNFVDIDVGSNGATPMHVSEASLTIEIYSGHVGRIGSPEPVLVQTLRPTMPALSVPAPTLVRNALGEINNNAAKTGTEAPAWWTFYSRGCIGINNMAEIASRSKTGPLPYASPANAEKRKRLRGRFFKDNMNPRVLGAENTNEPRRGAVFYGYDAEDALPRLFKPRGNATVADAEQLQGSDVVQTVTVKHGDYRLTAAMNDVGPDQWQQHRYYGVRRLAHNFTNFTSNQLPGYDFGAQADLSHRLVPTQKGATYANPRIPDLPYLDAAVTQAQALGDFDNGPGPARDGPYINKPDEGNVNVVANNGVPYLNEAKDHTTANDLFFTPNRLISSPVMLGSLPTGVKSGNAWRTLQFRPQQGHPGGPAKLGGIDPPDHLLLEYFWMPVVQPYAISEPFSTAGKINLNYQIFPFTNIRRASALHALLASERITAVPTSDAPNYKSQPAAGGFWSAPDKRWHYKIDAEKTLAQFEARFTSGKAFLSPSEICDIHLVPNQDVESYAKMDAFWSERRLTGDNTRERPYSNLYPRLTTRSNTYRVHYTAQVIRKSRSSPPDMVTSADKFDSEYRGSSVIERYLDPAQANLPDFTAATTGSAESLDSHYQFRVLEKRKFGN